MNNETTGAKAAALAARGLKDPASLSPADIRIVCGSALTQVEGQEGDEHVEAEAHSIIGEWLDRQRDDPGVEANWMLDRLVDLARSYASEHKREMEEKEALRVVLTRARFWIDQGRHHTGHAIIDRAADAATDEKLRQIDAALSRTPTP